MRAAAAQMLVQRGDDLPARRGWVAVEQGLRRHQNPGQAVAALAGLLFHEGDLQGVVAAQTLDRGDGASGDGAEFAGAGVGGFPVDQDHATAALLQAATVAGAFEVEMVAQHVQKWRGGIGLGGSGLSVDGQYCGHDVPLPFVAIGRHGLQGKQNLYQHTWRVPFIAKGPGIKPGTRAEGNTYLLDVLATLCDFAGIAAPASNEGLSFRPVLEGKKPFVRDVVYGVYNGGTKPGMRSVKQGDWKLVKFDVLGGTVRETQLFNLRENPHEFLEQHHAPALIALTGVTPAAHQRNLATDPRHAAKLAELEALLLSEMRRLDDPWRLWNQPTDGLTPPPEAPATKGKKQAKN